MKMVGGAEGRSAMTPKPSSSGICTSRRRTSGAVSATRATASRPSQASPTTSRSGWRAMSCRSARRPRGSSSASTTRKRSVIGGLGVGRVGRVGRVADRQRERCRGSAVGGGELEVAAVAMEAVEALARVAQAHAGCVGEREGRREARAVVGDGEAQLVAVARGGDVETAGAGAARDSVLEGVFDQRLEDELRDESLAEVVVDGPGDVEATAEAHAPDLQGRLGEGALLAA